MTDYIGMKNNQMRLDIKIWGKFYMFIRCYRCGEIKDKERFKPDQPYWSRWCIRCKSSLIGALPRRETENDKVK